MYSVGKMRCTLSCTTLRSYYTSSRFRNHSHRSYYEILGVGRGCVDINKIKSAFRDKAKRLHPDVVKSSGSSITMEEAHAQFIQLKNAYDVLIDPIERARYSAQQYHNESNPSTQTSSSSEDYDHHYEHDDFHHRRGNDQEWEQFNREQANWRREFESSPFYRRARRKRYERYGDDITAYSYSVYELFKQDLERALQHAYEGPTFSQSVEALFPEQFEIEERSAKMGSGPYQIGMEIAHIVSGRQLLGTIREIESVLLQEDKWTNIMGLDNHKNNGNYTYEEMGLKDTTLELTWMNRKIAKATRKSQHQIVFCVSSDDQYKYENGGNREDDSENTTVYKHKATLVTSYSGMFGQYKHQTLLDKDGDPSHAVINQRSPGVQFINFHSRRGFLEFKCSKAWLPDSRWWTFDPRDEQFDCGGWYVEQNKDGKLTRGRVGSWRYKQYEEEEKARAKERMNGNYSEDTSIQESSKDDDTLNLCPSVPMLLCGFLTFDKLRGQI